MANTVIKLKKSSVPSEVPSTLEYGELAINYADGKLFYKDGLGSIQEISGGGGGGAAFSTINVDNSLIVAGGTGAVLGIHAGDNIVLSADVINDILTIAANLQPAFDVANSAFDKANSANVLAYNTGVGANAYTDVSTQASNNYAGVMANSANAYATSLTPDLSPAFNKANDAYTVANSAFDVANGAFGNANSTLTLAQAAFDRANSSNDVLYVAAAFLQANDAYAVANAAFDRANLSNDILFIEASFNIANAAYDKANNALANTSGTVFDGNLVVSNSVIVGQTTLSDYRIKSYDLAIESNGHETIFRSSGAIVPSGPFIGSTYESNYVDVSSYPLRIGSLIYGIEIKTSSDIGATPQNTFTWIYGTDGRQYWPDGSVQNTAFTKTVYDTANAAYDKANTANVLAYDTGIGANAYSVVVGASGNVYTNLSTTSANNYAGYLSNTIYGYVNDSIIIANAAYDKANNALANSSGVVFDGDLIITGSVTIGASELTNFTLITSSNNNQILDHFDTTLYRSAHYTITINSGVEWETTQVSLIHNSSDTFITEYGLLYTANILATFSASVVLGEVRLNVVPKYASSTIRVLRTTLDD